MTYSFPTRRASDLQKRAARERAGAYEVVERSRQNAQGLAAAALGQRTDEESPMLTATSQAVVAPGSRRLREEGFVGDHVLASETGHRLAPYLRGPEQQPRGFFAVTENGRESCRERVWT